MSIGVAWRRRTEVNLRLVVKPDRPCLVPCLLGRVGVKCGGRWRGLDGKVRMASSLRLATCRALLHLYQPAFLHDTSACSSSCDYTISWPELRHLTSSPDIRREPILLDTNAQLISSPRYILTTSQPVPLSTPPDTNKPQTCPTSERRSSASFPCTTRTVCGRSH